MINIIGKTEIIEAMVDPEIFPDIKLDYCNKASFQQAFNAKFPECTLSFKDIDVYQYKWHITYTKYCE